MAQNPSFSSLTIFSFSSHFSLSYFFLSLCDNLRSNVIFNFSGYLSLSLILSFSFSLYIGPFFFSYPCVSILHPLSLIFVFFIFLFCSMILFNNELSYIQVSIFIFYKIWVLVEFLLFPDSCFTPIISVSTSVYIFIYIYIHIYSYICIYI